MKKATTYAFPCIYIWFIFFKIKWFMVRAVPDYRLIKHMFGALMCITILRANFFYKVWLVILVFVQFFFTKGWGFNCLSHNFLFFSMINNWRAKNIFCAWRPKKSQTRPCMDPLCTKLSSEINGWRNLRSAAVNITGHDD